ncbi:MAG: acetylxylan esterase [Acidobacteria bacterium]|nr:acetylxylan esterase [Acidobacteriota bacterium]
MTRRELIRWSCAAAAVAGPLRSANEIAYREYSRCLPDFLASLAREAYQRRKTAIARINTPAAVRRRAAWARKTFWELIGGQPERTPLNPRTVGTLERDGYRIEKVIYESRPNYLISANLFVPTTGKPPYPGVLFQMGHSPNGKAMGVYQACCLGLVKLGFVVLGFDPMGQGERVYYPGIGSPDDEHTIPAFQMLLIGDTATRWQTWDSVRSLDYLASHPLVDPRRLASTGQSGGGTTSMFLAAADPRLATAAASSPPALLTMANRTW